MAQNTQHKVINIDDFATQKANAKSSLRSAINQLVRLSNREKLSYDQLRYIFQTVRFKCDIRPSMLPNRLYVLPTATDINKFYSVIDNVVHKLIFESLDGTGLRVSELCKLKIENIDFAANTIFVEQGKGGKDRICVIGNRLKEKLLIYLEGKINIYVFESNRHKRFTTRRIQQLCKHYSEKAGLEVAITPHTFRHLWNTRLAESGVEREKREILAGHSKGSKTQDIYTHLGVGGVKDEVIKILDEV